MSKSKKHKNREKSLEQRAFETLDNRANQFDEPILSGHTSKTGPAGTGGRGRPPKFAVSLKLKNGKTLSGTCVSFDNPKMPKSKLFFTTGKQRTGGGGVKEFCIPSPIDFRSQSGEIALMNDVNDFLKDIHEQALAEFPEWLEKWGCRANETNPLLNLDDIREEWRYKKGQFGVFRFAAQAGFFTDARPFCAERPEIAEIKINNLP
jgi:hypothetical protein